MPMDRHALAKSDLLTPFYEPLEKLCVCSFCRVVEFEKHLVPALSDFKFTLHRHRLRPNTYFIRNAKGGVWALFVYHPGFSPLLTRWNGSNFDDDDGTIHSIVLTVLVEMSGLLDEPECNDGLVQSVPSIGGGGDAA